MPTSTSPTAPIRTGADGIGGDNTGTVRDEVEEQDAFTIAGITRLTDLNEQLNLNLESQYSDTIGGYIQHILGKMPEIGETADLGDWQATVSKANQRQLISLHLRHRPAEPPPVPED